MKNFFHLLILLSIITVVFHKCANPGRPTGGPMDTIPPVLIYANPISGTTNFRGEIIELEFSEYINADKLKQELIITPKSDIRYKSIVKRNRLILKLEDDLLDSTTYYLNFANGVTDITEKTPAVNLSIAFSTGPFIDSMSVSGSVEELLSKEPGKGYVVSLYPNSDSLDYFTDSPMYFTTANDSGNYKLDYIKQGDYKIIAFNDDNKNFLLDPETESHGFLTPVIKLDSATKLPEIRCVLQNIKPLTLINTRPTGRYVEIKFNKQVDNYNLSPDSIYSNIIGENNDIIRLYKPDWISYKDSLTSHITANDSLGNQVIDTIKYVFLESNRKPAGFSVSTPASVILKDTISLSLKFNKPIIANYPDSIQFRADSIFLYKPEKEIVWNINKTKAEIKISTIADSLMANFERSIPMDTSKVDSTQNSSSTKSKHKLELVIKSGAFISIESDTTKTKSIALKEANPAPTGKLKLDLSTHHQSFILQLLDKSDKVAYSFRNNPNIIASVKPDTYKIRVLIDTDNNGKWSYGNLLKNEQPEEVFLYSEEISVRENWEIDMSITF